MRTQLRDFASLLPTQVIGDMPGFPPAMDRRLHEWAGAVANFQRTGGLADAADALQEIDACTGVKHIAFGGGFRLCLGAALSHLEPRIALEELLTRVETPKVTGPPTERLTSWLVGYTSLPVDLHITPAG